MRISTAWGLLIDSVTAHSPEHAFYLTILPIKATFFKVREPLKRVNPIFLALTLLFLSFKPSQSRDLA